MQSAHYKIWQKGPAVGQGVTESFHVGVAAVAKTDGPQAPHAVANEHICASLARAICLPVPPVFQIVMDSKIWSASMNFNLSGQNLPPASAKELVAAFPDLAWGIFLFDVWICNPDRHSGNLSFDQQKKQVQIFDHSHALFARNGLTSLQLNQNQLGTGGHCLAPHLTDYFLADPWLKRISEVPEHYIDCALGGLESINVDAALAFSTKNFLLNRVLQLKQLVKANPACLPLVLNLDAW